MRDPVRLQKYLALCGVASRRRAEQFIAAGRVTVDGVVVREMGLTIIEGKNLIAVDGRQVVREKKLYYYLLNKPKGYITSARDPQGRPTVTSLIKNPPVRLYPVGRLDYDTEGALLLTNDGELAQRIQHPSYETRKTYEALVRGLPQRELLNRMQRGLLIDQRLTSPARVTVLAKKGGNSLLEITIHEGRKHQVKKMCKAIGHPVLELKRTAYGALYLGSLVPGEYRELKAFEVKKIFL